MVNEWLAALRNGKYKQGIHFLRNKHNEFCCLGVLCDILPEGEWVTNGHKHYTFRADEEWVNSTLPTDIILKFNVPVRTLIKMNDDGISFLEIADYIEKYYIEEAENYHEPQTKN